MTEQEVIKKFEELGYRVNKKNKYITLCKDTWIIFINPSNKTYDCQELDGKSCIIDMQEHQLLTELFKCWKWIE